MGRFPEAVGRAENCGHNVTYKMSVRYVRRVCVSPKLREEFWNRNKVKKLSIPRWYLKPREW